MSVRSWTKESMFLTLMSLRNPAHGHGTSYGEAAGNVSVCLSYQQTFIHSCKTELLQPSSQHQHSIMVPLYVKANDKYSNIGIHFFIKYNLQTVGLCAYLYNNKVEEFVRCLQNIRNVNPTLWLLLDYEYILRSNITVLVHIYLSFVSLKYS